MVDLASPERAEALLALWFPADLDDPDAVEAACGAWFGASAELDARLARDFADLPVRATAGELDAWKATPRGALARILCLDQLPRNLHRGDARAFACDAAALEAATEAIESGFDAALHPLQATFLYLPFEHAESLAAQHRCVELFGGLCDRAPDELRARFDGFVDYARRHLAVIETFGRFPHRNAALGRTSTGQEQRYLDGGGETFGGGDADHG